MDPQPPQSFAQYVETLVSKTVDLYLPNQEKSMRGLLQSAGKDYVVLFYAQSQRRVFALAHVVGIAEVESP
jgi:hypothetical protein